MHDLRVIYKNGPEETVPFVLGNAIPPPQELPPSHLPSKYSAFRMRVETPPLFPPEGRAQLEKDAADIERELLRDLGYTNVPQRLRSSPLVKKSGGLKTSQEKLARRGLYEITARQYKDGSIEEDTQRVKTLKTRRHRVIKRFDRLTEEGGPPPAP